MRDLRCELWSRHLNRPSATLGDPLADLALWSGIVAGTVTGTSVRPYDAMAIVPRVTNKVPPEVLEKLWDEAFDPGMNRPLRMPKPEI